MQLETVAGEKEWMRWNVAGEKYARWCVAAWRSWAWSKMDVVANRNEDSRKTKKHTHSMYKTKQPELFTGCNGPVCAQHGCEYDVVGTAMTSTEMGDELHRSEEKEGETWDIWAAEGLVLLLELAEREISWQDWLKSDNI